jgi:hypothetical protein
MIQKCTPRTTKTIGTRTSLYSSGALSLTIAVKDDINEGCAYHVTLSSEDLSHYQNLITAASGEAKSRAKITTKVYSLVMTDTLDRDYLDIQTFATETAVRTFLADSYSPGRIDALIKGTTMAWHSEDADPSDEPNMSLRYVVREVLP